MLKKTTKIGATVWVKQDASPETKRDFQFMFVPELTDSVGLVLRFKGWADSEKKCCILSNGYNYPSEMIEELEVAETGEFITVTNDIKKWRPYNPELHESLIGSMFKITLNDGCNYRIEISDNETTPIPYYAAVKFSLAQSKEPFELTIDSLGKPAYYIEFNGSIKAGKCTIEGIFVDKVIASGKQFKREHLFLNKEDAKKAFKRLVDKVWI